MENKLKKLATLIGVLSSTFLVSCNLYNAKENNSNDNIPIKEDNTPTIDSNIDNDIIISTNNDTTTIIDDNNDNKDTKLVINEDMSYGVIHPLDVYNVDGIIKNKYAQISTVSGDTLESSKVNFRYIFELDMSDKDLSQYEIKVILSVKHSRSDEVLRSFETNIDTIYNGYYSDGKLITKDNISYVVYTLTNIPYDSWDYDFDVNCVIIGDDKIESSDTSNNVLSVLVEENNDILNCGFEFHKEEDKDEFILTNYTSNSENVVIPDRAVYTEINQETNRSYSYYKEVTGIGENLFKDNTIVKSVIISNGIKTIGNNAFDGCINLRKVIMPNTVTTIGENAFDNCNNLDELVVSKNLTTIGSDAFLNKAYTIYYGGLVDEVRKVISDTFIDENNVWYYKTYDESTINSKGNHWYYKWDNVNEIIAKTYHEVTLFISKNEIIYKYVANNESVELNNDIDLEGRYFFGWYLNGKLYGEDDKITSDTQIDAKWVYANFSQDDMLGYELYDIHELDLETIDLTKFNDYRRIKSISLSTKNIGSQHPYNDKTKTIILPDTIQKISDNVFYGFRNIKDVYFKGNISSWLDIKFDNLYSNPSSCPSFENFYIKEDYIDDYNKFTTLNIPEIYEINNNNNNKIGDYQFFNMRQIENIILPDYINVIGKSAFGMYNDWQYNSTIQNVYYFGNSCTKNEIIMTNNKEYNNYDENIIIFNRLSPDTNWYYNRINDLPELPGTYWWYDDNSNIEVGTYYEIVIKYDGLMQENTYIRKSNSDFDINIAECDFYYDESYNEIYTPSKITSDLKLYAKNKNNMSCNLLDSGDYYTVIGINQNDYHIIIPDTYNNKPVQKIAENAFKDNTKIISITLSKNINEIGLNAFEGCINLNDVFWNDSFNDWVNIKFNNYYSNPMTYAKNFNILMKDLIINEYQYRKLDYALMSNNTDIPMNFAYINDYSLIGFKTLLIECPYLGVSKDAFSSSSIEEIYILNTKDYVSNTGGPYYDIMNNIGNMPIKVYRYIKDFRIIDNYIINENNYDEINNYSGYWVNFSCDENNNEFAPQTQNKFLYFKVCIDRQVRFIKEGTLINNISLPNNASINVCYQMIDNERVEIDKNSPINSSNVDFNYDIYVEIDYNENPNPETTETRKVTFSSYNNYELNITVNNCEVNVQYGQTMKIVNNKIYLNQDDYAATFNLCDDEYELENIYIDQDYNQLFDLNTPITEDTILYPKYTYKFHGSLVYDTLYNRYAYTVYLNDYCDIHGRSLIIPSTYRGLPVISISMDPNNFNNDVSIYNLMIPEGIRYINPLAFKYVSVENLVLPTSLKYFNKNAFGNAFGDDYYNSNIRNVYYNGSIFDWLNIQFENEQSNPIYYSKNLHLSKSVIYYDNNNYYFNVDNYSLLTDLVINSDNDYELVHYNLKDEIMIGKYQFINLESLINIDFSNFNKAISIGEYAFSGCSKLETIKYFRFDNYNMNNRNYIGKYAFANCMSIESIILGSSMDIESYSFDKTHIRMLNIVVNNRYIIRSNAFSNAMIEKVYYKNNINKDFFNIESYISSNNYELYNSEWFNYNDNTEYVGKYWYYDNDGNIQEYDCGKIILRFNYDFSDLVFVFNKKENCNLYNRSNIEEKINEYLTRYYILDDIYKDSSYSKLYNFDNFDMNNEVIIYVKVVPNLFYEYGNYEDKSGYYIKELNEWQDINQFGNEPNSCLIIPDYYKGLPIIGIDERAFANCHINNIIMPNTIVEIRDYAFENTLINYCKLSNTLEVIGNYAFYNTRLNPNFKLPSTLKTIGDYAFAESSITGIMLPNSLTSLGKGAFKNCNLSVVFNRSLITEIPEEAFAIDDEHNNYIYNYDLLIEIPENVSSIGKDAFKNRRDIRMIIYSSNVSFDEEAFATNNFYFRTNEIYIYPKTFTSNLNIFSSEFRIFNYTSDYEERRYGNWWYFANLQDIQNLIYMDISYSGYIYVRTIINL